MHVHVSIVSVLALYEGYPQKSTYYCLGKQDYDYSLIQREEV